MITEISRNPLPTSRRPPSRRGGDATLFEIFDTRTARMLISASAVPGELQASGTSTRLDYRAGWLVNTAAAGRIYPWGTHGVPDGDALPWDHIPRLFRLSLPAARGRSSL